MGGLTRIVSLVLLLIVTSCTREPPEYDSTYTPTPVTSVGVARVPQFVQSASFFDDFDRADTSFGLGEGWDLRGPVVGQDVPPPATDGFIRAGRYSYAGTSVVTAARQFRSAVRAIGASGRWTQTADGSETTMVMAISANEKLVSDMLHFAATRTGWELTSRRNGGPFRTIAKGSYRSKLQLDQEYRFELEVSDSMVTIRTPDKEITRSVASTEFLGIYAFWEEYPRNFPRNLPAGIVFQFDRVWAVEEGQFQDSPVR